MSSQPTLELSRNGLPLCSHVLDGLQPDRLDVTLSELQPVGFAVRDAEPDTDYLLRVGDIPIPPTAAFGPGYASPELGHRVASDVFWEDQAWFESARGLIVVTLSSRAHDPEQPWRERASLEVRVLPSKLGEARFTMMLDEVMQAAEGLIFDLVSKSTKAVTYGRRAGGVSSRPPHVELRVLQKTWSSIAAALQEIVQSPEVKLTRKLELGRCWGGERLSPASFGHFAVAGLHPGRGLVSRPFTAVREKVHVSIDTVEHRTIRAALEFLASRVQACASSIAVQSARLDQDRPYRDVKFGSGPTLFEEQDAPRLEKLKRAQEEAGRLARGIRLSIDQSFLRHLRSEVGLPVTPIFQCVAPYRAFYQAMCRYLSSSLVLLDRPGEERIKSTARLYEQWALLQVIAAFREAGFTVAAGSGLFSRAEGRRTFVVDIERGAQVVFQASDGRRIFLRYEPWILSKVSALQAGDTLYRGKSGDTPWSPDIVIEVQRPSAASGGFVTEYAIALDIKYSSRVREHHWRDTTKYRQIRATLTDRKVLRQLWIIYPGAHGVVGLEDPSLSWTEDGPDCQKDEEIDGTLALLPSETASDGASGSSPAYGFVRGTIRFLGLQPTSS